jgi:hypothetical protein
VDVALAGGDQDEVGLLGTEGADDIEPVERRGVAVATDQQASGMAVLCLPGHDPEGGLARCQEPIPTAGLKAELRQPHRIFL